MLGIYFLYGYTQHVFYAQKLESDYAPDFLFILSRQNIPQGRVKYVSLNLSFHPTVDCEPQDRRAYKGNAKILGHSAKRNQGKEIRENYESRTQPRDKGERQPYGNLAPKTHSPPPVIPGQGSRAQRVGHSKQARRAVQKGRANRIPHFSTAYR